MTQSNNNTHYKNDKNHDTKYTRKQIIVTTQCYQTLATKNENNASNVNNNDDDGHDDDDDDCR